MSFRPALRRAFLERSTFSPLRSKARLTLEDRMTGLKVGKIYRLRFPGIAARVIEPPARRAKSRYPYLVESVFLRSRWWVNEHGEPDNIHSPRLIIPTSHDGEDRQVSGGK